MDDDSKTTRQHAVRVRVSDAELEFLRRVAREQDRSLSSVLRLALREFYDRQTAAA
jgi:predicted transcriptional regulator